MIEQKKRRIQEGYASFFVILFKFERYSYLTSSNSTSVTLFSELPLPVLVPAF